MYRPDVVGLKQFYASALGKTACVHVWRALKRLWPEFSGETALGLGYAIPYVSPQSAGRDLVVAGMPAQQGALYWPQGVANRVVLLEDAQLPFADNAFNRVLLVHALEHSDDLTGLMEEMWRVLVPGGRMLAVVPNRLGLWSHSMASPYGYGRPFSSAQMRDTVARSGLTLTRVECALFMPPSQARWVLKCAPFLEVLGKTVFPRMGGVLLVEAEKQIYAALRESVRAREKQVVMGIPATQPAFSPLIPGRR